MEGRRQLLAMKGRGACVDRHHLAGTLKPADHSTNGSSGGEGQELDVHDVPLTAMAGILKLLSSYLIPLRY